MRGKMKIAGFLLAGILLAAALLLFLTRQGAPDGDSTPGEIGKYQVTDYPAEQVEAIEVLNAAGERYTIRLDEGGVSIDGIGPGVPLRRTLLLPVISLLLQGVSYSDPLPAERAGEYGMDTPRAVFTLCLSDGETAVLRLGDETVKKNGLYLWPENSGEIYVVEYAYDTMASYGPYDYIDPVLAEIDQSGGFTISRLTLTNRAAGTELDIVRKSAADRSDPSIYSYQVTGLSVYDAADEKLNAYLFDRLALLRAAGVYSLDVSEKNLEELGLLNPAYTLSFTDDQKGQGVFHFSRLEDGGALVLAEGTPVVYELAEADAAFLDVTLEQIVSPFLLLQSITEVERFTVYDGEKEFIFCLQNGPSSGELLVTYNGTAVDTASFRKLYSRAAAIYIQGVAERPEGVEPALRVDYLCRSGETHVTEFFPLDGRRCFAAVDGSGEFFVRLTDVEYFLEGLYACIRGEALTE